MSTETESGTACQAHALQQNFFRPTIGADAGKPPFDPVSLTVRSLLCRFCAVKLSFLFGNHFVVSMNWMSIKPIAGPQASNDTKSLASTRARRSRHPSSTAKDRLESRSLICAPFGCRRASYAHRAAAFFSFRERTSEPKPASSRRDKLPIIRPHRQKSTPDKPPSHLLPVCSPSRVARRQTERPSGLFAEKAFQRSHLQRRKSNDRMMHPRHAMTFPLSEQSPTVPNSILQLGHSHP